MHPQISSLYQLYKAETQPFRKVHRLIDLFESILKSHTAVIIAEYVCQNQLSEAAKGLLAQGLRTPSLGTWQLFSRVLAGELNQGKFGWTIPHFAEEFAQLDQALNQEKTNVVAFRNGYAHGATPSDEQCLQDIRKFEPFLEQVLQYKWLNQTRIEVRQNQVWICTSSNAELCLQPILLYRPEGENPPYAFFNDLKNDKVGLLNYPLSKHYREKDFWDEFHRILPLQDWKKSGNNEFYQRIEELTETFKGRTEGRKQLLQFVHSRNKGYFSIQGNPGIGKSALIAQFSRDLRASEELKRVLVIEFFINRNTQAEFFLNYLIRRTDELFPQGREIRAEKNDLYAVKLQLFSKWRLWAEHSNGSKLLFLIDGLDEGVENNLVSYLPRENFENILFIYGSRPGGHKSIDDLWGTLPAEHHNKIELTGLSKEDIRALIYEVASKYEIERDSPWIEAVQQRSQGNPLYLKLLCDALENGSIALNEINALPEKIDVYYKAILLRYANDPDGDALLDALFSFAAAKDYLTFSHLGLINKLGSARLLRIGSTLKEVLYENPLTEEVLDYQLFHESFREYLLDPTSVKQKTRKEPKGSKSFDLLQAEERLLDFCAGWKELEGSWEQRYALEHYAAHLSESPKVERHETLLKLLYDKSFAAEQKRVLKNYGASNQLFRLALLKAADMNRQQDLLESALGLVDLKYEEANDAPAVVALVANGEIDAALRRIDSFGGTDKEGVQRRFTLYMLCLMELSLLGSKEKPFRKEAIEKLLAHLDAHIPADTSIINWNDFFSSYLMFLMACEWAGLGLDHLLVYKRTAEWETDWIEEKGPYQDAQFELLLECTRSISSDGKKSSSLAAISTELAKQEMLEEASYTINEAIEFAKGISDHGAKNIALKHISTELAKQGRVETSLVYARGISDGYWKSRALKDISAELTKLGKLEEAGSAMQEVIEFALGASKDWENSKVLKVISMGLSKQGKFTESHGCALGIVDERVKNNAINDISIEMAIQRKSNEALSCARGINDNYWKIKALSTVSTEISKQGKTEEAASAIHEALELARGIIDGWAKNKLLNDISTELAKQGKPEAALECAWGISDYRALNGTLKNISTELAKQRFISKSLACAQSISDNFLKIIALTSISTEVTKQNEIVKAETVVQESLKCYREIDTEEVQIFLTSLSDKMIKQGKIEESLVIIHNIKNKYLKSSALKEASVELAKKGNIIKSLEFINSITNNLRNEALKDLSLELARKRKIEEALEFVQEIKDVDLKSSALKNISIELTKQGMMEEAASVMIEALKWARSIKNKFEKTRALATISTKLAIQGKMEEAASVMKEAFESSSSIIFDHRKCGAQKDISIELSKQGKIEESLEYARSIDRELDRSLAITTITFNLVEHGNSEVFEDSIEEAFTCARGIVDELEKSRALHFISDELASQGNWKLSEKTGLEIPLIWERQMSWQVIASKACEKEGWQKALEQVNHFSNEEARLFYLKGWAEAIQLNQTDAACLQRALALLAGDSESIENLLQKYAVRELFFGHADKEQIQRLNKSLNLQWALDVKAQFLIEEGAASRLSTNLDAWLAETEDEDDREQIQLWAKQVAKGKISEEEFGERVKGL